MYTSSQFLSDPGFNTLLNDHVAEYVAAGDALSKTFLAIKLDRSLTEAGLEDEQQHDAVVAEFVRRVAAAV